MVSTIKFVMEAMRKRLFFNGERGKVDDIIMLTVKFLVLLNYLLLLGKVINKIIEKLWISVFQNGNKLSKDFLTENDLR